MPLIRYAPYRGGSKISTPRTVSQCFTIRPRGPPFLPFFFSSLGSLAEYRFCAVCSASPAGCRRGLFVSSFAALIFALFFSRILDEAGFADMHAPAVNNPPHAYAVPGCACGVYVFHVAVIIGEIGFDSAARAPDRRHRRQRKGRRSSFGNS